jgi:release factor glutamine methyltransferase
MLLKEFIAEGVASLRDLYPEEEARSVVLLLCEVELGVQRYTHIIAPQTEIPPAKEAVLSKAMERLRAAEPVQYVTGVASFCGHDFRVTGDVLIPRPETECLVREACAAAETLERTRIGSGEPLRILDLCTGSGCIAWSLSLALPGARVTGVDISEAALEVARGQAFGRELRRLGARAPEFIRQDILEGDIPFPEHSFDLLVSNPPYILESQKASMRRNVLDYEPALALFVPDTDPLLFYRAVARWSRHCLSPRGRGFAEINEDLGPQTRDLFAAEGFERAAVRKDYFGKNRLISY